MMLIKENHAKNSVYFKNHGFVAGKIENNRLRQVYLYVYFEVYSQKFKI